MLRRRLVLAGLVAAAVAAVTPASATAASGYCSPSGDYCYSARLRDGAVYVRHKASTEEADSADIEMLTRRASGTRRRIAGVSVVLSPAKFIDLFLNFGQCTQINRGKKRATIDMLHS